MAKCGQCGKCVRRCHFDAFYHDGTKTLVDGKHRKTVQFDPLKCWGCGLCATTCPDDAIAMVSLFDNLVCDAYSRIRYKSDTHYGIRTRGLMNGHKLAARFVAETRWENLPAAVQRKARMCFADSLGATLAGTLTRVSRISADYAAEAWGGDQATILRHEPGRGLHGLRASMAGAAFANANAANGLDLDDSARYAYGHAGAQIIPAALAVAEALDRTRRRAADRPGRGLRGRAPDRPLLARQPRRLPGVRLVGQRGVRGRGRQPDAADPGAGRPRVGHRGIPRGQPADDARRGRSGHGQARHRLGRDDRRHRGRAGRAGLHRHPHPPCASRSTRNGPATSARTT